MSQVPRPKGSMALPAGQAVSSLPAMPSSSSLTRGSCPALGLGEAQELWGCGLRRTLPATGGALGSSARRKLLTLLMENCVFLQGSCPIDEFLTGR